MSAFLGPPRCRSRRTLRLRGRAHVIRCGQDRGHDRKHAKYVTICDGASDVSWSVVVCWNDGTTGIEPVPASVRYDTGQPLVEVGINGDGEVVFAKSTAPRGFAPRSR